MKIFFYKTVLVFLFFILAFHFSFNYTVKKISTLVDEKTSKEAFELIKKDLREELKNAVGKENYIKPDDAKLINQFLKKIKEELEKNK